MKTILKTIIFNSLLMLAIPGFAQRVGVGIHIQVGPPEPRQEVIIERPYPEAIWVPGYYIYDPAPAIYVWKPGRWQRPPHHGARWIEPEWKHEKGEYHFHHGRWK